MSTWPLPPSHDELFVAGRSLAEWEAELGRVFEVRYPWDLLAINEEVMGGLEDWPGHAGVQLGEGAEVMVGEGTKILPGVFIEGRIMIGRNCKIGPNCYLRGSTSIGDGCHVGQAVEVKNSILSDGVSVGHLSYVGDSVIGPRANFGAGTITSNLRHDGSNHRSVVEGELIDTGRRKFGVVIGAGVHTGINTSFYPGRKMGPGTSTLPGGVVSEDIHESSF